MIPLDAEQKCISTDDDIASEPSVYVCCDPIMIVLTIFQ